MVEAISIIYPACSFKLLLPVFQIADRCKPLFPPVKMEQFLFLLTYEKKPNPDSSFSCIIWTKKSNKNQAQLLTYGAFNLLCVDNVIAHDSQFF